MSEADPERQKALRLLAALERALERLDKRVDGNTDPSKVAFLQRRNIYLLSEVSGLQQQLGMKRVK